MSEHPSRSPHDSSLSKARICHLIPGRMRLRIPKRRGDIDYFALLRQKFTALDGVQGVEVNPSTSSLLISHSLDDVDSLTEYARAESLFDVTLNDSEESVSDIISGHALSVDRGLQAFSSGKLNLSSLGFLVFLCLAIVQILRGQFFVPAITLFWYAIQALEMESQKKDHDNKDE